MVLLPIEESNQLILGHTRILQLLVDALDLKNQDLSLRNVNVQKYKDVFDIERRERKCNKNLFCFIFNLFKCLASSVHETE